MENETNVGAHCNVPLPVLILFGIILMCAIQMTACSRKENTAGVNDGYRGDLPGMRQEVYSFRVEGFNKDRKVQWNLEGESASVALDKVNINDLKAVYYGKDITFTVSAKKAVLDKKTQDIELEENIVGKTSDGGELFASRARWNSKTEEIRSNSYVTVKRENVLCRGRGLVTKPRLKKAVFMEDVKVNIAPDTEITCDGPFKIDHDKKEAIFNKNVKVINKDSETLADKLTVYLNPETNEIERLVTEGNVSIVHKGDVEKLGELSF